MFLVFMIYIKKSKPTPISRLLRKPKRKPTPTFKKIEKKPKPTATIKIDINPALLYMRPHEIDMYKLFGNIAIIFASCY